MSKKRYSYRPGDGHACHWLIPGPPAKPVGTCRLCGAEREFVNTPTKMGQRLDSRVATVPLDSPGKEASA